MQLLIVWALRAIFIGIIITAIRKTWNVIVNHLS